MKFRKDNRIRYGQDHSQFRGIPSGVDFEVVAFPHFGVLMWTLWACGYGCTERHHDGCYGNGSLIVWGLTKRQEKRFEAAEAVEAKRKEK